MSLTGWRNTECGDSSVRITNAIICTGEDMLCCRKTAIDELAIVKFKWIAKKTNDVLIIEFFYASSKHKLAKDCRIKVNISSYTLKYFKQDIDAPENWSEWQSMGFIEPKLHKGTYIDLFDCYISAYEYKMDKLCTILHTDTDFTDFHLVTTEGAVAVHKSCLAAHSEVFKNMLKGEWKETAEGKINIEGVSLQTLEHLKNYMYLGTMPDEGLCPLLLIARCYLIEELQKQCIRKLAETVAAEDLYSLIEFACENKIPELAYAMMQITHESVVTKAEKLRKKSRQEKANC